MVAISSHDAINKWLYFVVLALPITIASNPSLGADLSGVILLTGLCLGWKKTSLTPPEKYLLFALALFPLLLLFSVFLFPDTARGINHWGKYIAYLVAIPTYIMVRFYTQEYRNILFLASSFGALCLFSWGVYELEALGLERVGGGRNPIPYGNQSALFAIVLTIGLLSLKLSKPKMLWYGITLLAALVACWWSQTRGAWLALFFAPLMAIFVLANIRTKIIAIITGVTMVIGISAAVYFELGSASRLITAWNQASEFFENPSEACTSIGIRLNMWRNVLIMLGDAPLFGVGLYGYQDAVKTLIEQGLSYNTDCQVTYQHTAHSIYFHTLAMSGVIGLFSLLLVFLGFIYAIYKAPANIMDKLLPLTIIFMFMLFGLTTSWTQKSLSTSTFLIFSILLVANLYGKHNEPAK
jgi:O-antigen ligase